MGNVATNAVGSRLRDKGLFRQACYIAGSWLSQSGKWVAVDVPATGDIIGQVPQLGGAETRLAIDAASAALPSWRRNTGKERAAILRRWSDLVMAAQDDLATIMT